MIGCNSPKVTFIVSTPPNTEHVTIAGNHPQLGNWNPNEIYLDNIDTNLFEITITIPTNIDIEYKFTSGSWATEALNENRQIPNNHTFSIKNDTIIKHTIHKWKDENPINGQITGTVQYHRVFYSPELDNYRDIVVWIPPSYQDTIQRCYPVLYLHDGQNVFDPSTSFAGDDWQLDETVTQLIEEGKLKEIIMIGIYNTDDRTAEYSPKQKGKEYSKFLIETLKPFIDSNYNTLTDPKNTAVMGSSSGGLISYHLAWEYPEVFSMAGCLSPAFLVDKSEIVKRVKSTDNGKSIKLVILNGTIGLETELQPAITDIINVLEEKQFNKLIYKIFDGAEHNESAWAKQVEIPLLFFFGKNTKEE